MADRRVASVARSTGGFLGSGRMGRAQQQVRDLDAFAQAGEDDEASVFRDLHWSFGDEDLILWGRTRTVISHAGNQPA